MQLVAHRGRAHLLRVLLLSVGVALLWTLITLFAQSSPSSAAEDDGKTGKGLLGAVPSTVNHVTGAVASTVGEVGTITKTVVKAAEPVTKPVLAVAPQPVRETVKTVVKKTVATVDKTTAAVDTTVRTVTDKTLTTVSDVVAKTPVVGDLVGSPAPLTPVIPPVESVLPDLDPVLGTTPDAPAPGAPLPADAVPTTPVAPTVAAPATDAVTTSEVAFGASVVDAWHAIGATTATVAASALTAALPALGGLPVDMPSSAPASTGALVLTFGAMAILVVARPRFAASFFRTSGPRNDALPGAPVYETDTSPG